MPYKLGTLCDLMALQKYNMRHSTPLVGDRSILTMRKQCMRFPTPQHDSTATNTNLFSAVMAKFVYCPDKCLILSDDFVEMYSFQLLFLVLLDNQTYVEVINIRDTPSDVSVFVCSSYVSEHMATHTCLPSRFDASDSLSVSLFPLSSLFPLCPLSLSLSL
jgi:hypothetical protein